MKPILVLLAGLILSATAAAQQSSDPCASLKEDQQVMESRLRDWPDLAKYQEKDAKLGPRIIRGRPFHAMLVAFLQKKPTRSRERRHPL